MKIEQNRENAQLNSPFRLRWLGVRLEVLDRYQSFTAGDPPPFPLMQKSIFADSIITS
jgi:hypothetical protein